jgi:hypothetical protein
MNRSTIGVVMVGALALAAPLRAQDKQRDTVAVPRAQLPPRGMCRIWIDGVPPTQQPAPTDCASAVRNRPANGRVIFSDDGAKGSVPKLPVNTLAPQRGGPADKDKKAKPRKPDDPPADTPDTDT